MLMFIILSQQKQKKKEIFFMSSARADRDHRYVEMNIQIKRFSLLLETNTLDIMKRKATARGTL